ncbi:MotA/TolQ/ExbB proton channel family protein [Pseudorhodobacter sp.]|uniref:MotA/TolQ/ExbB proton channel family protein n=1 Tax=Pseudorhodobacter sp. TaxID=1934400 RepID=UPI002649A3A6|nr:MotA/TolQ/ExbB proton channel family protein [Pseudorhodobacter sp.]MDN5786747.1 MotA/TolQ/ExbB proton channel family protein [Pseudorhodobacter sp.]
MLDLAGLNAVTILVFAALLLLSVSATTVALFKFVQFAMLGLGRGRKAAAALAIWDSGHKDKALAAISAVKGVQPRVLRAALAARLQRPDDPDWAEEIGRQVALAELAAMGRWMRVLEAVVQAAPMLGLLGTVVGMIDAFGALAQSTGGVDPALLAGGIWTALSTTAIGLAIALVFYFIAIWLETRIDGERQALEVLLSAAIHGSAETITSTPRGP